MKRFDERKTDLINATNRLKEALQKEEDDITIDGVLHRYEFTFELAWKTLKDYWSIWEFHQRQEVREKY